MSPEIDDASQETISEAVPTESQAGSQEPVVCICKISLPPSTSKSHLTIDTTGVHS